MVDGLDTLQRSMSLARLDSKPNLETVCSKDTGVSDSEAPTLVSMHSSGTTEVDSNPEAYAVLRVECIEARSLKVYIVCRFFIQHFCQGLWIVAFVVNFSPSHSGRYYSLPLLIYALVLAAICGPVLFAASIKFLQAVCRAYNANQTWTKRRRRLATLHLLQLLLMAMSNLFLAMSSGVGRQRSECQIYTRFCAACDFLIWTALVGVLSIQYVLTHNACVWTDGDGAPTRLLLMQKWLKPDRQQKYALILDASWLVHLPKLFLWALIQASLVMQLADAMSGSPYFQLTCDMDGHGVCIQTHTYKSAQQMRIAFLTFQQFFMAFTVVQGIQDMQILPYNIGRLGRVLMRLRISRGMGVSHGGMLGVGLLLATSLGHTPCSSCLQSWLLLASNLQATVIVVLASFLFTPVRPSANKTLIMQVWLQSFAWTENSLSAKKDSRSAVGTLQEGATLAQEPRFCFETSVKLLYWCGMAYEYQEGRTDLRLSEATAMQLYGLEHLHLMRDPITGTKCLIAWGEGHIVISFRGTANVRNARHDAKAWLVPLEVVGPGSGCAWHTGPAVHSGFKASWHAGLKASLTGFIRQTVCPHAELASKMHVKITGHSLGGVMAVLSAMDIADLLPWASLQVYTFGAPRPGNKAFSKMYNSKVPDTWHILNEKDPVPLMAKFGVLYVRPGHRVLVTPRGDMLIRPTPLDHKLSTSGQRLNRHLLTAYRASLVEVIRTQLRQPKFDQGMEGVLELAESIDLTSALLAADMDVKTPQPAKAAAATIASAFTTHGINV